MRNKKPLAIAIMLAAIGCVIPSVAAAHDKKSARTESAAESTVIVAVYNQAGIPPKTVLRAEKISAEVFQQAGLQTDWVNCGNPHVVDVDPRCKVYTGLRFDLHIVRKSVDTPAAVLGLAFVPGAGTGRHADLFYENVVRMQTESGVDVSTILGHVAAHELGHLLLGKDHSRTGLMRANWTHEDLSDASRGLLLFSKDESERLRSGLLLAQMEQQSPAGKVLGTADAAACTVRCEP